MRRQRPLAPPLLQHPGLFSTVSCGSLYGRYPSITLELTTTYAPNQLHRSIICKGHSFCPQRLQRFVAAAHVPSLPLPFDSDSWSRATRLLLRLLRMRADVFQLGVDGAAYQDAAVTTAAAAAAAGEFALNDGGSCVRKLIVSLTPAAAAALVAGDASVQHKLANRVRAIIMHRSTSYSDDVLVACISSDEQVLASHRRRIIALQPAIRFSNFCEGEHCSRSSPLLPGRLHGRLHIA